MNTARVLAALFLLVGLGGTLISGSRVAAHLLYLSILLVAGAWIWTRWLVHSVQLQRRARAVRANVGDILVEHFEVSNAGRLLAPWLEVKNESKLPFAAGSRVLTVLGARHKRGYLARTWLRRRGGFALGPTLITTGDAFGLFRAARRIPAQQSLTVLPMLFDLQSFPAPPGLLPGGRAVRGKALDVTPHAAGVRDYAHGDPMKRIHWPISLRRGHLMVKEFDQDPQAELWLVLDAQERVHVEKAAPEFEAPFETMLLSRRPKFELPPSTLEYGVSIAASLARYFLHQRRSVGLLAAGKVHTVLPAERSNRQEGKILETLAYVEGRGKLSLAGVVSAQTAQFPRGSTVVLITTSFSQDLLAAVDHLQLRKLRPAVIVLLAGTFGGASRAWDGEPFLRERRVPLRLIAYRDDLAQAFAGFSTDTFGVDRMPWQKTASAFST